MGYEMKRTDLYIQTYDIAIKILEHGLEVADMAEVQDTNWFMCEYLRTVYRVTKSFYQKYKKAKSGRYGQVTDGFIDALKREKSAMLLTGKTHTERRNGVS